jgi:ABC-2 type transport system permease protein
VSDFAYDVWVLSGRAWRLTNTGTALAAMVVTPLVFLIGSLLVFSGVMHNYGIDYAQFLPPAVVAQAMMLTAISTASAVGEDRTSGVLNRLRTLPLRAAAVPVARLAVEGVRALVSVVAVVAVGYVAGFRLHSIAGTIGFVALATAFAMSLCFGTAALALKVAQPEAVYSLLYLPYLPLLTLSTVFAPIEAFPNWLMPVVRLNPVTAVVDALRAFAAGTPPGAVVVKAVVWVAALAIVLGYAAARAFRRVTP